MPSEVDDAHLKRLAEQALASFSARDFDAALRTYVDLNRAEPDDAFYADRVAACLTMLGRWSEAKEAWAGTAERNGLKGRLHSLLQSSNESGDFAYAHALVVANEAAVGEVADTLVLAVTACIGVKDVPRAVACARRIDAHRSERRGAALNHLCASLGRLGRGSHRDAVLGLIGALSRDFSCRHALLRIAIDLASEHRLWQAKLAFAEQTILSCPGERNGYVRRVEALTDLGRFKEAADAIAALRTSAIDTGDMAREIADLEFRCQSLMAWQAFAPSAEAGAFAGLVTAAARHAKLGEYKQALRVYREGLTSHPDHPWLQLHLGLTLSVLGDDDGALRWIGRACAASGPDPNALLHLCRMQIKAGMAEDARRTAEAVSALVPDILALDEIARMLGLAADRPTAARTASPPSAARGWLHGGDAGDVLYALPAMRAGGGGHLYLTCIVGTREPMSAPKVAFLAPLIERQPYVTGVSLWQGEEVDRNFIAMRHHMVLDVDLVTLHWRSVLAEPDVDLGSHWLTVDERPPHGRPVFARSARYRNPRWETLWTELKARSADAIFVGTEQEHAEFGHGEHMAVQDAHEMAQIIKGCSLFVGNQSFAYALAEGLKVPRLLEVCPWVPNCTYPGALPLVF